MINQLREIHFLIVRGLYLAGLVGTSAFVAGLLFALAKNVI